jgi:Zn ribbon nucleic-acid-binding protein
MIIIPKEETKKYKVMIVGDGLPKQETLEEASKRAVKSGLFKDETLFIAGAKFQQEQDKNKYSEEDMIEFVEWIANTKLHGHSKQLYEAMIRYKVETTQKLLKLWFEQFKIKGDYGDYQRKYKISIHQILEQSKKK